MVGIMRLLFNSYLSNFALFIGSTPLSYFEVDP